MEIGIPNEPLISRMNTIKEISLESELDFAGKVEQFENSLKQTDVQGTERVKTLEQWIESLEEIKMRLEQDITKDNLDLYKDSVKKFLDYYVKNDLYLNEHSAKDGLFYTKKIQVIKAVDEKIDALTDNLVNSQMGRLEILKQTGQIQGMLIDIVV